MAQELLIDCATGQQQVVTFTPQPPTAAEIERQRDQLRAARNTKLRDCDFTQLADVPLNAQQIQQWRTYRQQLRDYMGTVADPFNPPAWPVPPSL